MSVPIKENFEVELENILERARNQGREFKIVISKELHEKVGSYPGPNHRMPICCSVMKNRMKVGDTITNQPKKGNGATLTIKYLLI